MAKGKRRRPVVWRTVGSLDHAWVVGRATSACDGFGLGESGLAQGKERCARCEEAIEKS